MLINIRGTSGSGKSTLVRRIRENYLRSVRIMEEGRKQPIGYVEHAAKEGIAPLGIVGHYETDCGGCDTVSGLDKIFDMVRAGHAQGYDVIFEGLIVCSDLNRLYKLHDDGLPLLVVGLDTSLEDCLASVNERRQNAWQRKVESVAEFNAEQERVGRKKFKKVPDQPEDVNPKNTTAKHKMVTTGMQRLKDHGVDARWCNREEAYDAIMEALGWKL